MWINNSGLMQCMCRGQVYDDYANGIFCITVNDPPTLGNANYGASISNILL